MTAREKILKIGTDLVLSQVNFSLVGEMLIASLIFWNSSG